MTKNILELGIYIAILSLLLGILGLISTIVTDVGETKSQNSVHNSYYQQQLQN